MVEDDFLSWLEYTEGLSGGRSGLQGHWKEGLEDILDHDRQLILRSG